MKYLKIIIPFLALLLSIVACTNDDLITKPQNVQESDAMKAVVAQLDLHVDDQGVLISDQNPTGNIEVDFCFDFVYPITLVYNTGTTVTVNNFEELVVVIINSTPELYIVGIEFPFNVSWYNPATNEIEILTITSEEEFIDLLESCIFNECICTDEYDPVCVEIITDEGPLTLTFPNACFAECEGFTEEDFVVCENDCDCPNEIDPVCVTSPNGGTIEFDNFCLAECEGFTEEDIVACDDSCECPSEIDPVCVEADNGNIIEFDNKCLAMCEGYTPNDFVDCPTDSCEITNLTVQVGDCSPNAPNLYTVVVDFEHTNATNDLFDVYVRNNVLIGTYALNELPLTLTDFELSGLDYDYLRVCINDAPDCCAEIEWMPPSCETGDCSISNLNVEIGDCNPSGTYSLTIDFDHMNAGNDFFDVFVRNNEFIGFFSLSDLPVTIDNFELSGFDYDFIQVCINDTPNCCNEMEWLPPNCQNSCDCPNEYDPVCVELNNGNIITYFNACFAECDGFNNADFIDCIETCDQCLNEPYDPVCIEASNGQILTMYNECFMFCNGFTPNNVVNCE